MPRRVAPHRRAMSGLKRATRPFKRSTVHSFRLITQFYGFL
jgi:hypothetical protein